MRKGETLSMAAVRETREEAGVVLEPTGLVSVEYSPQGEYDWIRYGVTGKIVGGNPKRHSDEHSLQARWVGVRCFCFVSFCTVRPLISCAPLSLLRM